MGSPQNPNQPQPQPQTPPPPFDINTFFNPPSIPNPSSSYCASYPPPSYSYPPHSHIPSSLSFPTPPPNAGARLMALLTSPQPQPQPPPPTNISPFHLIHPHFTLSSNNNNNNLPKGRHLVGNHVVYDVDVALQGEVPPQLEVTPITKYGSDPNPVLGRQIAVSKSYICYALKQGHIRLLNFNTALRSLLRGHVQRVTDLAFFAKDVHLLASVGIDGRIYVWKIFEGPDEENKLQITAKVVIAIQIEADEKIENPRICWHCHKQEVLVVGMGKRILRIDTTKVALGEAYVAEEPPRCPIGRLIDGVQLVGTHDGEVTDMSMCQWMKNHLVSASRDGMIKIWEDCKAEPLVVLKPHGGQPVFSAIFLAAPDQPDHIVLITAGRQNQEVKLWVSASEEGQLLPSDTELWKCTQTLELKSSAQPSLKDTFFNQVAALSDAGLLLFANAQRNAIYAVHLEYGPNPESTCMDYIAEFSVTMPILSFIGTSDILPHGEPIVQVYCVQTYDIQQYALDLAQCLPPPLENVELEKSDSSVSRDAIAAEGFTFLDSSASADRTIELSLTSSSPKTLVHLSSTGSALATRYPLSSGHIEDPTSKEINSSYTEAKTVALATTSNDTDIVCVPSLPLPLSPRLSRELSDIRSPKSKMSDHVEDHLVHDYSVDWQMDAIHRNLYDVQPLDSVSRNDEKHVTLDDLSIVLNPSVMFKHPTHLITPSEIVKAGSSSENNIIDSMSEGEAKIQGVVVNSDVGNAKVEVKVGGEARPNQSNEFSVQGHEQNPVSYSNQRFFCSQASDLGNEMAQECCAISGETFIAEEPGQVDSGVGNSLPRPFNLGEDGLQDLAKDMQEKISDSSTSTMIPPLPAPNTKGNRQKGKYSQASGPSSSSPTACNSNDSSNEPSESSTIPSTENAFTQIQAMQETLNQLLTTQKEMQKQMTMMVAVPVTKEGKRLEAALGRSMEKAVKANTDTLWARLQEENAKNEKLLKDRIQHVTGSISSFINMDLPTILEKTVKKEMASVGSTLARAISPSIEKTMSSAIVESFQRGVGDKAVNQLDKSVNSKLEATVVRQIQAQFQMTSKQVLQDALKSSFETSMVPAFEMSCKAMFENVDATFQKGMVEYTTAVEQQLESGHTSLAMGLRDTINSASSLTQTLSRELVEGHRKLLALAAAGPNSSTLNPLPIQLNSVPFLHEKVEVSLDPTKELMRLISERKYEEAFTGALQRSDVSIMSWLCSQVDLRGLLSMVPLPLSQGVVLSLLQQLACDINNDAPRKIAWMIDVAAAINPTDPTITMHVRPIFGQVYQILNHQRSLPTMTAPELSSIRLLLHVINSMLMTCK